MLQGIPGRSLMRQICKWRCVWEIMSGVKKLYRGALEDEAGKIEKIWKLDTKEHGLDPVDSGEKRSTLRRCQHHVVFTYCQGRKSISVIWGVLESLLQPISSPLITSFSKYHISEMPLLGIHSLGLYSLFSFEMQTPLERVTCCH